MRPITYLACPYRHPDPLVRKKRLAAANLVAAELYAQGKLVYSPLTHNITLSDMAAKHDAALSLEFDARIFSQCGNLVVLKLPGWEESSGVAQEIAWAKERGIAIEEKEPPAEETIHKVLHDPLTILLNEVIAFFIVRDWEQFHSPKNLAINLASEVGEVLDYFKWVTEADSYRIAGEAREGLKDEIGDAFMSLIYLAQKLGIDPIAATRDKLVKLDKRYPVALCKGKCAKHTHYQAS